MSEPAPRPDPVPFPVVEDSGLASVVTAAREDDIAAICGRIDSAVTYAVVVHAPRGNRQLSQELGMRRLQRHAEEAGKIVAIATRSGSLANRARLAGIPVARKPQHIRWDSGGRFVLRVGPWSVLVPRMGALVQLAVIALILGGAGFAALSVLPKATVTIAPPATSLSEPVVLTASADRTDVDAQSLEVPLTEVRATRRVTIAIRTTGKTAMPTKAAKAIVTMTNSGPTEVIVPLGAVLISKESLEFRLDLETVVPPRSAVTQSATAVRPGVAGNVPAASVTRWQDAGIAGRLTVTNAQAATGGASEDRPAVDAADITTIKALAKGIEASDSARRTIVDGRPNDGVFLGTATAVARFGEPGAAAGDIADFLFLDVDVTVTAKAVPREALEEVARAKLGGRAPGPLIPGSVGAIEEGVAETNQQGALRNTFRLTVRFAEAFDEGEIESAVRGKSKDDAEAALRAAMPKSSPSVALSPSWAPWLPRFGFRIGVEVAEVSGATPPPATATPSATPTRTVTPATVTPATTPTTPAGSPTPSATRRP